MGSSNRISYRSGGAGMEILEVSCVISIDVFEINRDDLEYP